jgi:hypothetical protein
MHYKIPVFFRRLKLFLRFNGCPVYLRFKKSSPDCWNEYEASCTQQEIFFAHSTGKSRYNVNLSRHGIVPKKGN